MSVTARQPRHSQMGSQVSLQAVCFQKLAVHSKLLETSRHLPEGAWRASSLDMAQVPQGPLTMEQPQDCQREKCDLISGP